VARRLAELLGYRYLDTGAMYRGIAYAYSTKAPADLASFLAEVPLRFSFGERTLVFLDEEDISEQIRTPEMSLLASSLSQDRRVRDYLTRIQREMGRNGGVVVEGRDTGSVVFPDADVKFYLDADIGERAKRRYLELVSRNAREDMQTVREEIEKRDRDDSHREIAPLVRPPGAVVVDTTGKTIDEVVATLGLRVRQVAR
jgi:cytidylate kinase